MKSLSSFPLPISFLCCYCAGASGPSVMAQQFQVLRCCSCSVFQVLQVKKNKKWNCKMCGEKQSILKVYGQGSGSDCRHHVQKLNLLQGQVEEASGKEFRSVEEPVERGDKNTFTLENNLEWQDRKDKLVSRWTKYLGEQKEEPEDEDEDEEAKLYTEKQAYYLKMKRVKDPRRKHTTPLDDAGSQEPVERKVPKFAKDISGVEDERNPTTAGEKSCEPVAHNRWTSIERNPVCKRDKDPDSRHDTLSKWKKFLSCDTACKSNSPDAGRAGVVPLVRAQRAFSTVHAQTGGSSPTHSSSSCVGMHPRESLPPSTSARVNSCNLARSLFSTGEDFEEI